MSEKQPKPIRIITKAFAEELDSSISPRSITHVNLVQGKKLLWQKEVYSAVDCLVFKAPIPGYANRIGKAKEKAEKILKALTS